MRNRIELRITDEKKAAFRTYCEKQGKSMTEILLNYIDSCTDSKTLVRTESSKSVRTNPSNVKSVRTNPKEATTAPSWLAKLQESQARQKARKKV